MNDLQSTFDTLRLTTENGLSTSYSTELSGTSYPRKITDLLQNKLKPDAVYWLNNKPIILFYSHTTKDYADLTELFKNIWNFNESPIIIFKKVGATEIYNGFEFLSEAKSLQLIGNDSDLEDFNYYNLITGQTWLKYNSRFKYQNRVDYHLLKNIEEARNKLRLEFKVTANIANSLIGKCIFIRYLIDRKVRINFRNQSKLMSNREFCSILRTKSIARELFIVIDNQFESEIFKLSSEDYDKINQDVFNTLADLLEGTEITSGQLSLFNIYDFSIIPVEFISNIYEKFIGPDEQDNQGAYYTPLFLVDYILSQTIEKYFSQYSDEYNCAILDPSCGSGVFLVEVLRKIITQYIKINPEIVKNADEYQETLSKLVLSNVFGIDRDREAINVAVFSIYLTLLDYQYPPDIETFQFPKLLNTNLFCSDVFDSEAEFNIILDVIQFRFIIGNPPWKKRLGDTQKYVKNYIEKRKLNEKIALKAKGKKFKDYSINEQIAQAFLIRVSDFCNDNTLISLIVASKIFTNETSLKFRKYFLDNYFITEMIELAPIRREIFNTSNDPSIHPPCILFYKYANLRDTDYNKFTHITIIPNAFFSMFKSFCIQFNDVNEIQQAVLKKHDYLWKAFIFGNYLDYNFIKRLKDCYPSIGDILKKTPHFK